MPGVIMAQEGGWCVGNGRRWGQRVSGARPQGLWASTKGLDFILNMPVDIPGSGMLQHDTAVRKIFAESGWMYHRPSPAFGTSGPSDLPLEAPGCSEFEPVCAFLRKMEQCETVWNSMGALWSQGCVFSRAQLSWPL